MIDLRAEAERLKLCAVENGNRSGDVAGLLDGEERVHEGIESGRVLEMNGDDAAARSRVVGRLDAFNDGVGSSAGGEEAGFGVLIGLELPPRVVKNANEEALRIAHLDLAAGQ